MPCFAGHGSLKDYTWLRTITISWSVCSSLGSFGLKKIAKSITFAVALKKEDE